MTHGHHDHYSEKIFDLMKDNDVTYILSKDIKTDQENINWVEPGDQIKIDDLNIEVFGSTDLGVSFLIEHKGQRFFHSGDLNWWHWTSFTPEQLIQEEVDFKRVVDQLFNKKIDFYFVPVDHRLKEFSHLAFDYVKNNIKPKYLIPIHFGDHFETVKSLKGNETTQVLLAKKIRDLIYS